MPFGTPVSVCTDVPAALPTFETIQALRLCTQSHSWLLWPMTKALYCECTLVSLCLLCRFLACHFQQNGCAWVVLNRPWAASSHQVLLWQQLACTERGADQSNHSATTRTMLHVGALNLKLISLLASSFSPSCVGTNQYLVLYVAICGSIRTCFILWQYGAVQNLPPALPHIMPLFITCSCLWSEPQESWP